MNANSTFCGVLAACALLAVPATAAPVYRLTKLQPPAGSNSGVARAISSNGRIAGEGVASQSAVGNSPIAYGDGTVASAYTATTATATNSFVRGINDSGIAAGTAQNAAISSTAILTSTAGVTVLTPLSGFGGAGATGVNNSGRAVGYSIGTGIFAAEGTARPIGSAQGTQTATIWTNGVATALANPFGAFNGIATAINASGQIVGAANRSASAASTQAVIWNNGVATGLAIGASERASARAISSHGWVAGRTDSLATGSQTGTVWDAAGTRLSLNTVAGCTTTDARGINAGGNVVGFARFSEAGDCGGAVDSIGLLWQWNGSSHDAFALNDVVINLDGWNLFAPQGINDRGQIVGFGFDENGVNQGFLLTAVPEPASWAMLIAGFGLVGATARRRRAVIAA
jgi:uncharacterized membrane protein